MRVHRMDNLPRPMSWLPNREGYRFTAVFKDGTTAVCTVERRKDGTYFVGDASIDDMKGWFPLPLNSGTSHGF